MQCFQSCLSVCSGLWSCHASQNLFKLAHLGSLWPHPRVDLFNLVHSGNSPPSPTCWQSVDYLSTEKPSCVSKASHQKEKVHSHVLKADAIVISQQFYNLEPNCALKLRLVPDLLNRQEE